jgi:hypothetical protein
MQDRIIGLTARAATAERELAALRAAVKLLWTRCGLRISESNRVDLMNGDGNYESMGKVAPEHADALRKAVE